MHVARGTDILSDRLSQPDGGNKAYRAPVSFPPRTLTTIPFGNDRPTPVENGHA